MPFISAPATSNTIGGTSAAARNVISGNGSDGVFIQGNGATSNVVDVYLGYLRQKLEANGEPRLLHTVRGVGYVIRAG